MIRAEIEREAWTARRRSERTRPSTGELITLEEAKKHLNRSDVTTDDEMIERLIPMSVDYMEADLGRAFLTQTWKSWFDAIPCGGMLLLDRVPVIAVSAITAYDTADAATTVASTVYQVDTVSQPARVVLKTQQGWPTALRDYNALSVTYTAGYGAAATSVPGNFRSAALLILGAMFEHREQVIVAQFAGQFLALPFGYEELVGQFRCRA